MSDLNPPLIGIGGERLGEGDDISGSITPPGSFQQGRWPPAVLNVKAILLLQGSLRRPGISQKVIIFQETPGLACNDLCLLVVNLNLVTSAALHIAEAAYHVTP